MTEGRETTLDGRGRRWSESVSRIRRLRRRLRGPPAPVLPPRPAPRPRRTLARRPPGGDGQRPDGRRRRHPDVHPREAVPARGGSGCRSRSPTDAPFAIGTFFMPRRQDSLLWCMELVERALAEEGLPHLGWRTVPVRLDRLGPAAEAARPAIVQAFVGGPREVDPDEWERRLYLAGRVAARQARRQELRGFCVVSLSHRTLVYKALLTGTELKAFYPDLEDPDYATRIARFPPALLDEHAPDVGARAALPPPRAQRRDQHALGKPQRDAGARARARLARVGRPPPAPPPGPDRRGERLDEPRRGARAPRALGSRPAPRPHDAHPGRTAGPPPRRLCGPSTTSTPASSSRGTARRPSRSRTGSSRAPTSTARVSGPCAGRSRTTGTSSRPRRRGSWTSTTSTSSRAAASAPARRSRSTRRRATSSSTRT